MTTLDSSSKVFLITGASGGAAPYVARTLLARGDRVVLTARNADRLAELEHELSAGNAVATVTADVIEPEQAAMVAARAVEQFGRLDGLVHLAGAFRAGTPVIAAPPEVYLELYRANVVAAAVVTQAVLRQMRTGPGWLVYIGSLLAQEPMPTTGPYAASKSALLAWVRALGREVADLGINANAVVTTLLDTPKNRATQPDADHSRWVPAEDLAEVVDFLTSSGARSMFGMAVPVHGRFALVPPPGAVGGPPPGVIAGPPRSAVGGPPPGTVPQQHGRVGVPEAPLAGPPAGPRP